MLRYDIDLFSRDIVEHLTLTHQLIETKSDYFVDYRIDQFNAVKSRLLKRDEPDPKLPISIYGVRRVKTDKGYTVFLDLSSKRIKKLVWNKGNMRYIREGYDRRLIRHREMILQLHICFNGNVYFTYGKDGIKSLTLSSKNFASTNLPDGMINKLLSLKFDQEWFENILSVSSRAKMTANDDDAFNATLGNTLFQSCSSLQDFINLVNMRSYPISVDFFLNTNIYDIIHIMLLKSDPTRYFSNATDYFNFIDLTGSDLSHGLSIGTSLNGRVVHARPVRSPGVSVFES